MKHALFTSQMGDPLGKKNISLQLTRTRTHETCPFHVLGPEIQKPFKSMLFKENN
jgi:hypothetical protein